MATLWGKLALLASSWMVLVVGLRSLSEYVDTMVKPESSIRSSVVALLAGQQVGSWGVAAAESFVGAFHAVFGEKSLSWRFILRSWLVSTVFTSALCLIAWSTTGPALFLQQPTGAVAIANTMASEFFTGLVIVNLLGDYASLVKSTWAIQLMSILTDKARGLLWIVGIADVAASLLIGLLGLAIYEEVRQEASGAEMRVYSGRSIDQPLISEDTIGEKLGGLVSRLPAVLTFRSHDLESAKRDPAFSLMAQVVERMSGRPTVVREGVWLYSTLFTSSWLWIYVLSSRVLLLGQRTGGAWEWFRQHIAIDTRPFAAIGLIGMIILTVVYLIALPFVILFGR